MHCGRPPRAVPSSCGVENCVVDANRNGAFYCGIDQDGWYGKNPYSRYEGGFYATSCRANLEASLSAGKCGGDEVECGADDACASGYCDPDDNSCRPRAQTVGASCNSQSACGTLSSDPSVSLYCRSADSTCQPFLPTGGSCRGDGTDSCRFTETCSARTRVCGKQNSVGDSCSALSGCGPDASGTPLYCDLSTSSPVCAPKLNTAGADCRSNPEAACGTDSNEDGSVSPLYCSLPSFICLAKVAPGRSCAANPAQACDRRFGSYMCSSNTKTCVLQVTNEGDDCNADPYTQCGANLIYADAGYNGQLFPSIQVGSDGNQGCVCLREPSPPSQTPPPDTFGVTTIGADCSSDPTFACGFSPAGVKLYCALSTSTCQEHVTTVGESCAYDYLGACGISTSGGTYTQLFPSIPVGSSGHADCTCVTQQDVVVRPSSRARARARVRRSLSLCPGSHVACTVGKGFECIDIQVRF